MSGHDDDTVVLRPRRRRWPIGVVVALSLALGSGVGVLWFERPVPAVPAPTAPLPGLGTFANEAEIGADVPSVLTVFRFAPNPAILVLDFPDLASQGRMLNRIAAWAEKKGEPHDRVLTDAELASAIRESGTTPETYYYGHDYRGSDVQRFFALADRDKVALGPDEQRLRRMLGQAAAEPWGFGAVISLPRAAAEEAVDDVSRAVILHHELSHGEYFTNAVYARFVATIWQSVLTQEERTRFRTYLSNDGYDPALEDLMINEMQAYLMHTPDARFFDEQALGIPAPRLAEIRTTFLAGMPSCWLRDVTPDIDLMRRTGSSQPRRRQGRVSIVRASAARLPPRRRRVSMAV